MPEDRITISFVGNAQILKWLRQWAKEDDRSQSATLRRILEQEARRRAARQSTQQEAVYQTN